MPDGTEATKEHTCEIDTAGGGRLFLRRRTDGVFVIGIGVQFRESTNDVIELNRAEAERAIAWLMDRL
jgi:hypothetical protein